MDEQLYEKLESRSEQMTMLLEELQKLAESWQKIFEEEEIYQKKNEIKFMAKAKFLADFYLILDDSPGGFHNVMHETFSEILKASQKKEES